MPTKTKRELKALCTLCSRLYGAQKRTGTHEECLSFFGDPWVDRSIHASKSLNTLQFTLKSCNFRCFPLLFHRFFGRLLAPICRTRVRFFGGIFTQLSICNFLSSRSLLHFYGERRERKRTLAMIFVPCNVVSLLYDDDVQRHIRAH